MSEEVWVCRWPQARPASIHSHTPHQAITVKGFHKRSVVVMAIFAYISLLKTLYYVVFRCFTLAILKVDVLELMTSKLY